jgi:hypothetical protein
MGSSDAVPSNAHERFAAQGLASESRPDERLS